MLRLIFLLLILVNGLYFAWSQGLLSGLGWAPVQQSEPQRLGQQIRPEALRVLTAQELSQPEVVPVPVPVGPVAPASAPLVNAPPAE